MPDHKEMYRILFRKTSKAVLALQTVQQETEALYMADEENGTSTIINSSNKADEENYFPQGEYLTGNNSIRI